MKNCFPRWALIVFFSFIITHFFQKFVVFPAESRLLPDLVELASIVYLPHAVRVLAVAIVGPRAFLALFPAILFVSYFEFPPDNGLMSMQTVLIAVIGAGCAPVSYQIVKLSHRQESSFEDVLRNWKPVFLIGALASAINSIGLSAVFHDYFESWSFLIILAKYFVGDIVGLAVGLLLLVFAFRLFQGGKPSG